MKIRELLEQTVVPQTMAQNQPGQSTSNNSKATQTVGTTTTTAQPTTPQTTTPAGQTPTTPQTTTPAGQTPTTPAPQGSVPTGQPMGSGAASATANPAQTQQLQQTANQTMTDLDKISAQIVGLKQKQQHMQQQLQKPAV